MLIASTGRIRLSCSVASVTGCLDRPVDQVDHPARVEHLDQPVLGRLLGHEARRGEFGEGPLDLSCSRIRKSTSWSLECPPWAYTAKLPPSANGISACLSTEATRFKCVDEALVHPVLAWRFPASAVVRGGPAITRGIRRSHPQPQSSPVFPDIKPIQWYAGSPRSRVPVTTPGTVGRHGHRPRVSAALRRFAAPCPAARWPAGHRRLRTVALVGVDGSGKTTQAHRLAAELAALGLPATYRRNAGGRRWFGRLATALGRRDAEHLLGRRELLLVESVLRWLAIARTLLRRAVTGEIAVMDRYAACQYASLRAHAAVPARSAGAGASGSPGWHTASFPAPDVTFMLVVDPAVAYDRIEAAWVRPRDDGLPDAATAAYRALPEYGTFVTVDASGEPDEVSAAIQAHLAAWLPAPAELAVPAAPPVPADHHALGQQLVPVEDAAGPAVPAVNAKTILLAAGPLAAGASTVGYRVCEAVQSLV